MLQRQPACHLCSGLLFVSLVHHLVYHLVQLQSVVGQLMPPLAPRQRNILTATQETVGNDNTLLIKCYACEFQPVGVGQQPPDLFKKCLFTSACH